tara:strand:- start:24 stop:1088 length:1065 start_codon:yes stop_codon:yes gene_type:complete
MAYTTIDDGSEYFHTQLYTGNGSSNTITNDANAGDFKPDWVWIKTRNATRNHNTYDSSRGVTKAFEVNDGPAETTVSAGLTSFNTDGFTVGSDSNVNQGSINIVAWQWKANGGTATASGSESGNNPAYSYQANTTAGFSIVTYTGTGSAGTVSHGLGVAPDWILVKNRTDSGTDWCVYHSNNTSAPETDFIKLNTDEATEDVSSIWNDTAPTSTVFTVGTSNGTNGDGDNYLSFCFAEKKGYSKFGLYNGNGNANGVFVYTGFKPAWLMIKRTDSTGNWFIFDNKRDGFNSENNRLTADGDLAEADPGESELLSNGFKLRFTSGNVNSSSGTYIYIAFAEHPFVSSKGVPVTAR